MWDIKKKAFVDDETWEVWDTDGNDGVVTKYNVKKDFVQQEATKL